jgi:GntR family transcriptional regulator
MAGKKKWTETIKPGAKPAVKPKVNQPVQEKTISFTLDTANGAPIYRQIIQQIEYAVLSGRMKPGDRLPTIRSLAVELKTNPNTIARAYGELEIRGILATQVGSGTYISDKKPVVEDDNLNRKIRSVLKRFVQEMRDLGVEGRELVRLIESYIKEESR